MANAPNSTKKLPTENGSKKDIIYDMTGVTNSHFALYKTCCEASHLLPPLLPSHRPYFIQSHTRCLSPVVHNTPFH